MTEKDNVRRDILSLLTQISKAAFNMVQMTMTHQDAAALAIKNALIRRRAKGITIAGNTAECQLKDVAILLF